jgi:hypothetical protein
VISIELFFIFSAKMEINSRFKKKKIMKYRVYETNTGIIYIENYIYLALDEYDPLFLEIIYDYWSIVKDKEKLNKEFITWYYRPKNMNKWINEIDD